MAFRERGEGLPQHLGVELAQDEIARANPEAGCQVGRYPGQVTAVGSLGVRRAFERLAGDEEVLDQRDERRGGGRLRGGQAWCRDGPGFGSGGGEWALTGAASSRHAQRLTPELHNDALGVSTQAE